LDDSYIGWHAGNWEINRRSVGIALVGDYSDQDPSDKVLKVCAEIIKGYKGIGAGRIYGHKDISKTPTICPGNNFAGWKQKLIEFTFSTKLT
jgi:N-acetyl-anhydromuramyl-L-alanine amidase AmpD